ncbi:hypothetical protein BJ944DRAFT_28337 [Cunninghamella echinulata]|nr:hypothetical protein BJ944DRAFT_28337 [Cunninghamella echinulata]
MVIIHSQLITFLIFILYLQCTMTVSLNAIIGSTRECLPILNDCPDGFICVAELENFGHCKLNDIKRKTTTTIN